MERRKFLKQCCTAGPILLAAVRIGASQDEQKPAEVAGSERTPYKAADHYYGMAVDVSKCIGCGRCVDACKTENDVPREPEYFRTWIERYSIVEEAESIVESPNGGLDGFPPLANTQGVLRSFFVPKLCNQCENAPCVQVCPVGATFSSPDGVVLVDQEYCVGCRYCIQACPYGARFLHPQTRTAEKCTFCYHRLVKGLAPACVEVCPTGARMFGEIRQRNSPLTHFRRLSELQVLKPSLNTKPKVYYANLDGEVR